MTFYRFVRKGRNEGHKREWRTQKEPTSQEPAASASTIPHSEEPPPKIPKGKAKPGNKKDRGKQEGDVDPVPKEKDPLVEAKTLTTKEISRMQSSKATAQTMLNLITHNDSYIFARGNYQTNLEEGIKSASEVFNPSELRMDFQTMAFKDFKSKYAKDKDDLANTIVELNKLRLDVEPIANKLVLTVGKIVDMKAASDKLDAKTPK